MQDQTDYTADLYIPVRSFILKTLSSHEDLFTENIQLLAHMGLQKPSKHHIMAGKATIHSFDYEENDAEASAATGIDDGDDEYITVYLEMVVEHTTVSLGVVEHIAVHITVSLEMVVKHITVSLGQEGGWLVLWSTSQCR